MQRPPCNAAVGSESPILLVLWTRACVVSADMAIHHRQGHGLKRYTQYKSRTYDNSKTTHSLGAVFVPVSTPYWGPCLYPRR